MVITPSEFVLMLRLWEQCCFDVGEGWQKASSKLRELEIKVGTDMPMNYTDFEGFHVAVLRALEQVEEVV